MHKLKLASRSFSITMAVLALLALAAFLIKGQVSPALADDEAGLGKKIAGTYLGDQKDAGHILQISEDGNLSVIFSIEFSGGAAGLPFSDTLGSWKKTGKREITAATVDLDFRPEDGTFAGVGAATFVINFDKKFQTASVTCEGAIFPPGVNPFLDPDADPILDGEFSCGDLEFHRLPVDGDGDDDGKDEPSLKIRIGAVIDQSGNNSAPSWPDVLNLGVTHANQALQEKAFKNLQIELLLRDSTATPSVAVPLAIELAQQEGVKALITDTSADSIATNMTFYDDDSSNDLGVPIQCTGCSSARINNPSYTNASDPVEEAANRNGKKWLFRTNMSTGLISLIINRLIEASGTGATAGDVNGDNIVTLGIYHSSDAFGVGTLNTLKSFAEQVFVNPVFVERSFPANADPNTYTWTTDLDAFVNANVDAIATAAFAQHVAAMMGAHRDNGYAVRMLHVHTGRTESVIQILGVNRANGIEGVSHVLLDNGFHGETFDTELKKATGQAATYRDSIYYDNIVTLCLAAVIAAQRVDNPETVTGEQMKQALLDTEVVGGELVGTGPTEFAKAIDLITAGIPINYVGASGPMDYDENLNVLNKLAHYRIENGVYKDVAIFDCVADPVDCPPVP